MPALARVGDPTDHPGTVTGPGVPTVLIGGLPAAVMGDLHTCGKVPDPHPPSPLVATGVTVMIGGRPALLVGDKAGCGAGVVSGAPTVTSG